MLERHIEIRSDPIDPQRLIWLVARDTLLGSNHKRQDLQEAVRLARSCNWPEAKWLVKFYEQYGMPTKGNAKEMFMKEKDDMWAMAVTALISGDENLICCAAKKGDAFAQAWMCKNAFEQGSWYASGVVEGFSWAKRSANARRAFGTFLAG